MYSNFYNEKNDFFSIIAVSLLFHFAVIAAFLVVIWLRPVKEDPLPIPFFELVNVAVERKLAPEPKPQPVPEPVQEPVPEPESVPEPEPTPEPELAPEPKPQPTPVPTPIAPAPAKETPAPAAPSMDMPMDMPSDIKNDMAMPSGIQNDAYISMIDRLIRQHFNPPSGTEINQGTKSTVQFKISRNGEISEIVLRSSSGNSIWDRLAVRAVELTKPPPLPPNIDENRIWKVDFREEDFKEK